MELPREPHTRGAGAAGRAEGGAARRSHYGLLRGTSHQDSVTAAPATGGAAVCAQLPAAEIYEDSHFGSCAAVTWAPAQQKQLTSYF